MAEGSLVERWDDGGFRAFDGGGQDRSVGRFLGAAAAVRAASVSVLPSALIEARPFGTGAVFGKVAALEREVGRTRGGLSVRSLISTYGEVIAAITPCVLVSPDSLARFVAPGAHGLRPGGLRRGVPDHRAGRDRRAGPAAACVVAGDSQQMPPYSFGQLGTDEGEDTDSADFARRAGRGEHPVGVRAGGAAAAVAVLALPQPGREPDQLLQRAVLRGPPVVLPGVPRAAERHRRQLHPGRRDLPAQRARGTEKGLLRTNPVEAAAVVEEVLRRWQQRDAFDRCGDVQHPATGLIESMLWDSEVEGVREALAQQGRRVVREEPGERPGRRAGRDHLLHRRSRWTRAACCR